MLSKNILCCVNDNPIFYYTPLNIEKDIIEQVIINYVLESKNKRWLKKETVLDNNVLFSYYEINVEQAYEKITKNQNCKKNSAEEFCMSFIKYLTEDTPKKLIKFLRAMSSFTEKDLYEIEAEFNKLKIQKK